MRSIRDEIAQAQLARRMRMSLITHTTPQVNHSLVDLIWDIRGAARD